MQPLKLIELTNAVSAVCPIDGISVSATGALRVDYSPVATQQQRSAAASVIDGFDSEAPAVPQFVTPYQARCAITAAGMRDAAEAAIATADQGVRDAWEYALTIERGSPFITAIGAALGLSQQQIDALFVTAAGY